LELDLEGEQLRRGARTIPLRPKAFALLRYLVEHPNRVVSKEELLAAVWPGTVVTEAQLKNRVLEVRKALGDEAQTPRYIAAVPRRGYRFIGHLPRVSAPGGHQPEVVSDSRSSGNKLQDEKRDTPKVFPSPAPSTQPLPW
jgi:DNA-binding winged helix-turn-helix (wHTH) protein